MDTDDFDRIYNDHGPLVWSIIRAAGVPRNDAEDLFMRSWESIAHGIHRFSGKSKMSTWIAGIVRHKCIDHLRRKRPESAAGPEELDGLVGTEFVRPRPRSEHTLTPYLHAVAGEARAHIARAVAALPALQRTIFTLWMEGFDYATIASVANRTGTGHVDRSGIGVTLLRARASIRGLLHKAGIRGIEDLL